MNRNNQKEKTEKGKSLLCQNKMFEAACKHLDRNWYFWKTADIYFNFKQKMKTNSHYLFYNLISHSKNFKVLNKTELSPKQFSLSPIITASLPLNWLLGQKYYNLIWTFTFSFLRSKTIIIHANYFLHKNSMWSRGSQ